MINLITANTNDPEAPRAAPLSLKTLHPDQTLLLMENICIIQHNHAIIQTSSFWYEGEKIASFVSAALLQAHWMLAGRAFVCIRRYL